MSGLKIEREGGLAHVVMAWKPLNVLSIDRLNEIAAALDELEKEPVQVVVLESELERAFSAGVDVGDHQDAKMEEMLHAVHGVVRRLWNAPFVSIAAVNGPALGGGCEIAASCDFVLATERAVFALPEIRLGVYPPLAVAHFARLVGTRRATQMILTGDPVSGEEAARIGLVTDSVPMEELGQRVDGLATTLLRLSRSSLAETRAALRTAWGRDREEVLAEVEDHYLGSLMKTADAREGLEAFLEKRPPVWSHR